MDYWLKALGAGRRGHQLRDDWKNEKDGLLLTAATFGRRPGIRTGDGIVYYGAGYRVVFAAGYATSLAFHAENQEDTRWPWRVKVSLPWITEFIHDGVPLDDLNVDGRYLSESIKQHSHIRLTQLEFEAAVLGLGGSF